MRELSLHILDIAENGITAGADCIHIFVEEARSNDRLNIRIQDNGRGLPAEKLDKVIAAMKKAHPYETPAFDIIKLYNSQNSIN